MLGIPRGGVVTADAVAKKLSSANIAVDFDIIMPRKLTDIDNKEQAIGAVMKDGTTYLDEELISMLQITREYTEKEKAEQIISTFQTVELDEDELKISLFSNTRDKKGKNNKISKCSISYTRKY